MAGRQDRIGAFESPTDGYTVFNANAGARITVSGRLNVLTLSLDNATNREYRNHLSRVKEIMPEAVGSGHPDFITTPVHAHVHGSQP